MRTLRNTSAAFLLSLLQFAAVLPLSAQVDTRFDVANMKNVMLPKRVEVVASSRGLHTVRSQQTRDRSHDLRWRLDCRAVTRKRYAQIDQTSLQHSRRSVVHVCRWKN